MGRWHLIEEMRGWVVLVSRLLPGHDIASAIWMRNEGAKVSCEH
jgi:hypothetical protein